MLPKGNKFFLFRVDLFSEGAWCAGMQTVPVNLKRSCPPCPKWQTIYMNISVPLKLIGTDRPKASDQDFALFATQRFLDFCSSFRTSKVKSQDVPIFRITMLYCKCPKILDTKVSDKMTYANNVDPDQTAPEEQSDQGLHCLPVH